MSTDSVSQAIRDNPFETIELYNEMVKAKQAEEQHKRMVARRRHQANRHKATHLLHKRRRLLRCPRAAAVAPQQVRLPCIVCDNMRFTSQVWVRDDGKIGSLCPERHKGINPETIVSKFPINILHSYTFPAIDPVRARGCFSYVPSRHRSKDNVPEVVAVAFSDPDVMMHQKPWWVLLPQQSGRVPCCTGAPYSGFLAGSQSAPRILHRIYKDGDTPAGLGEPVVRPVEQRRDAYSVDHAHMHRILLDPTVRMLVTHSVEPRRHCIYPYLTFMVAINGTDLAAMAYCYADVQEMPTCSLCHLPCDPEMDVCIRHDDVDPAFVPERCSCVQRGALPCPTAFVPEGTVRLHVNGMSDVAADHSDRVQRFLQKIPQFSEGFTNLRQLCKAVDPAKERVLHITEAPCVLVLAPNVGMQLTIVPPSEPSVTVPQPRTTTLFD